jgi:hypothetical protein
LPIGSTARNGSPSSLICTGRAATGKEARFVSQPRYERALFPRPGVCHNILSRALRCTSSAGFFLPLERRWTARAKRRADRLFLPDTPRRPAARCHALHRFPRRAPQRSPFRSLQQNGAPGTDVVEGSFLRARLNGGQRDQPVVPNVEAIGRLWIQQSHSKSDF